MIKLPTPHEYETLKSFKNPYCITLYVPFVAPNAESSPNQITFKNLIKESRQLLEKSGLSPLEIKKLLRPAKELIEDPDFWQDAHAELAFFIAPKYFQYFRMPNTSGAVPIVLNGIFNLKPLDKVISSNKHYYLLTISHNSIHLYEGDNYQLSPLPVKGLPSNMEKSLSIDEFPHSRQLHPIAPVTAGKRSAAFHEQYDVSKTDKNMLLQYFRKIDKIIHNFLKNKDTPLIVGGVEYLLPIYKKANTYPHTLPDGIIGNLERMNVSELHQRLINLVGKK